ncbi:MAG TPA: capsule assembly Wzi family protein [Granulicella sp.]|jgi:hypothetical protein|nr:capsule assembly Wzi family protein [Granulicella sp.]
MKRFTAAPLLIACLAVCTLRAKSQSSTVGCMPAALDSNGPQGSTYIPMDSWIYPAADRLQALGYLDFVYLGLRPWTRLSLLHMLDEEANKIDDAPPDSEAVALYQALHRELGSDPRSAGVLHPCSSLESTYLRLGGIAGTPLRDSFHLGQTIVNDYGRPYQEGFNPISGFSTRSVAGRFALYFRGEYQHAPSAPGYSPSLANLLATIDDTPYATNPNQATIPLGPISATNDFRILEANLSYLLLNHEISFGKSDHWMGVAQGGSFAWSTNAENIYAFQIDRTEPLYVPLLSRLTGPFRYQFFVGSLKGHTAPNAPWIHVEKISFKPSENLEMGFERSTIWGGQGHVPITIHSFLHSFFSFQNVSAAEKNSTNDPGARFGTFDFSYRLPFMRKWLTLYSDSLVHDDVSPVDAPRHAAIRPGLYLARFPRFEHLDLRVEAASTDPPTGRSNGGNYLYTESVQKQGYTNKGMIIGDWIGRESKGGQAWLTYHLSPQENVQLSYREAKADNDFIPGGTTQNIYQASVTKRFHKDFELRALGQYEGWKAPVYKTGQQRDGLFAAQITWFPH